MIGPAASTRMETHASTSPSPWPIFRIASIAVFLVSLDSTLLFAAYAAIGASFPGA
jgi:hypothetical protein